MKRERDIMKQRERWWERVIMSWERRTEREREGERELERGIMKQRERESERERESDYKMRKKDWEREWLWESKNEGERERELGRMREIEKRWEVISIEWDVGMEKIYELQSCSPCYTYLSAKHIWQNHLLAPLQIGIQHMQYFRAFKGLGSINSTF